MIKSAHRRFPSPRCRASNSDPGHNRGKGAREERGEGARQGPDEGPSVDGRDRESQKRAQKDAGAASERDREGEERRKRGTDGVLAPHSFSRHLPP